jgi:hypothetical protein
MTTLLTAVLVSATGTGCGGPTTTGTMDMASAGGLTLKNVPTGCPSSETAADLWTSVVQPTCAVAGCHSTGGTSFALTAAADMHSKWVGVNSALYPQVGMPYVTANNLNTSFLMYKITGSQGKYGAQMPQTGIPLSTANMCKFVAWINSGAPAQ